MSSLGDKCKEYERATTEACAMRGLPLLARLDGRAFHTFTRGMRRPYDPIMAQWMIETTRYLLEKTHALVGYTQSDEITLAWHVSDDSLSEFLFGGRFQKIVSILAGMASAKFCQLVAMSSMAERANSLPHFDCRVWQVPSLREALLAFYWREDDAVKNSVSMAAQACYSDKELLGKHTGDKLEMLQARGIDWKAYPAHFKRGAYLQRKTTWTAIADDELARIPEKHRPAQDAVFQRSRVVLLHLPTIRAVANPEAVLFEGDAWEPRGNSDVLLDQGD